MRTLRFLLRKEFRQIRRDPTMLRMLLIVPVIQLLILSSAATFEVRNARLHVVDRDLSIESRALVQRMRASGLFELVSGATSMAGADEVLVDRDASAVLNIPPDFARNLERDGRARIQLLVDAEDGAAAGRILSYTNRIVGDWSRDADLESAPGAAPSLTVSRRGWYNPTLDYHHYMVPGILVVLVTIVGMTIASMNIVREKEIGTLEQLSVTPVTRAQFVASKLLPFWLIALFDLTVGLIVAKLVFDIPIEGSLLAIAVSAVAYLFVALGIGLWISTVVDTQQQAMFIAFAVNMVYLLMSGLFTPFSSMPPWAQMLGQLSPVKHFIEIMRAVLVRGAGLDTILHPLGILVAYGAVVFTLAIRQFSKRAG